MLTLVYGTRPEYIKLAPIAAELRALGTPYRVLCTGQHTTLLRGLPEEPAMVGASLSLPSHGDVDEWLDTAQAALSVALCDACRVVVQGDTMSALVSARVAAHDGLPLAHVEAGVRSHGPEPWPEEAARKEIDQLAQLRLPATGVALANLVLEHPEYCFHGAPTGNSIVSALARYTGLRHVRDPEPYVLVTLHRRELYCQEGAVQAIVDVLEDAAAEGVRILWPAHPATRPRATSVELVEPMGYLEFAVTLAYAYGVITDSGGVVEEAATLGVPTIILRRYNDRPEAVNAGIAVRCDPTPEGTAWALDVLENGEIVRQPTVAYGDARSAKRIADALSAWMR